MGKIQNNENRKKLPVIRYMIYLLLVISIVSGVALSRYVTTVSGTDSARAAKFDYTVTITDRDDTIINLDSVPPDNFATMYATAKLSLDADTACRFNDDEVAAVRKVTVTNTSEVAVNAVISGIQEFEDNGIVWCIFNENDAAYDDTDITTSVLTKLGYSAASPVPTTYSGLAGDLKTANAQTIMDWNSNASLGISLNNAKSLIIVFWAEHEQVKTYTQDIMNLDFEADNSGLIVDDFKLDVTVTQMD